jgi:Domain of unknown function (DUF5642)
MSMTRVLLGLVYAVAVVGSAACSNGSMLNRHIDIDKIFSVRSTFGPQYRVATSGPTGIDPRLLEPPKLTPDLTFDPADCSKYASGQTLPQGLRGRMAALSAEGDNNHFMTIAVQTSQRVPYQAISDNCKHMAFTGRTVKGVIDVIDAPHINGAKVLATRRVLEATVGGPNRAGELYNYTAYLGNCLVLVVANSLVAPNQPPAPVDVNKARQLLIDSVSAVRRWPL